MIIGDYKITGKNGDFIVTRTAVVQKGDNKGQSYDSDAHYLSKFYGALIFIMNQKLSLADLKNVKDVIKVLKDFSIELREGLKDYKIGELK